MFCRKKNYQNQKNGKIVNFIFQRHCMKKQVIGLYIYGLHITISALNWELNYSFIPYDTELIEYLRMRVVCIPLICDARRQTMRHSAHAREVHCWKQHGTSHLTLLYILILLSAKGKWVGTLPVSLHHRSMEWKLPFVPKSLVNLGFHLRLTKWDFKTRSRAYCYHSVPVMDRPDLICCIFH